MPVPVADDYAVAEVDVLASSVVNKLKIMRYRGKGAAALCELDRLGSELRDDLVILCDRTLELANQWIARADVGSSPEPTSTPRRRNTSRLPPKRKASSTKEKRTSKT